MCGECFTERDSNAAAQHYTDVLESNTSVLPCKAAFTRTPSTRVLRQAQSGRCLVPTLQRTERCTGEKDFSASLHASSKTPSKESTPQPLDFSHKQQDTAEKPVYVPPLTSPFYSHIISPLCDMLVAKQIIPLWVTPNQLSFAGFVCGLLAAVCARLRLYPLVAPFWWGYGLCDNLDGKVLYAGGINM